MAMSNAEKQKRHRDRRNAKLRKLEEMAAATPTSALQSFCDSIPGLSGDQLASIKDAIQAELDARAEAVSAEASGLSSHKRHPLYTRF